MGSESTRPRTEWGIESESMRARGIVVLVKSNQSVKIILYLPKTSTKRDSATIVLVFKALVASGGL
mgnify:CR=1 FL=1